jgi:addiction module RelB/DinJ family antitoxin
VSLGLPLQKEPLCAVAPLCYIRAMKDAIVRARVEPRLKEEAENVFERLGISTTEAIRMFLTQVKLRRGLPFAVEIPADLDILRSGSSRQAALDSCYDD